MATIIRQLILLVILSAITFGQSLEPYQSFGGARIYNTGRIEGFTLSKQINGGFRFDTNYFFNNIGSAISNRLTIKWGTAEYLFETSDSIANTQYIQGSGTPRFYLRVVGGTTGNIDAVLGDNTVQTIVDTVYPNTLYHIFFTWADSNGDGTGVFNGYSYGLRKTVNSTYTGFTSIGGTMILGAQSTVANFFRGKIHMVRFYNYRLSTDEIRKRQNNLSYSTYADKDADSTTYYSGALVKGRRYRIKLFVAGDNFSNVGATSNATDVEFIATGTTPTTWTNSSQLIRIGTIAEYLPSATTSTTWFDGGINSINLTSGSSPLPVNLAIYRFPDVTLYGDLAVNGDDITSDGDLTIDPAGLDLILDARVKIGQALSGSDHAQLDSVDVDSNAVEVYVGGVQYRALNTAYGGFYTAESYPDTIALTSADTLMTKGVLSNLTQEISRNVTQTDSMITVNVAGVYKVDYTSSFNRTTGAAELSCAMYVNDAIDVRAENHSEAKNNEDGNLSFHRIRYLAAGTTLKVKYFADSSKTIILEHQQFNVVRID